MGVWVRAWLRVGTVIAFTGGALWLLVEGDLGVPALLRGAGWAVAVWLACGLIWIALEHGEAYEDRREQLRRTDQGRLDQTKTILPSTSSDWPVMTSEVAEARKHATPTILTRGRPG